MHFFLRYFFSLAICMGMFAVTSAMAQTITVGFNEFPAEVNLLTSQHAVAQFARAAVSSGLVFQDSSGLNKKWRMFASDSFSVAGDGGRVSFRVKKGLSFTNANAIEGADLKFSLQRCQQLGQLPLVVDVSLRTLARPGRASEQWLDLKLASSDSLSKYQQMEELFNQQLSMCPILEQASSKLFGADLGKGTNIVGSGPFYVSDISRGQEIRLSKVAARVPTGAQAVILHSFKNPAQGLSALRSGSIDMFVGADDEMLEKAQKAESFFVVRCSTYIMVLRKGLQFSCENRLDVGSLAYAD